MSNLPHWMQWLVVFCAFTGAAFWLNVLGKLLTV
ncbi:hypothetical protein UFOVP653_7 [uncultured Caudovirales phage]|uniref:Uncharacterized protein n=1 Tax=uncultured Caudovirales phage TaxID=2100421 RepID=A0A6J5N7T2_9CAUD|nr:hypothetical protein UFOVP653_7 [uncultured Caudovirales phage]